MKKSLRGHGLAGIADFHHAEPAGVDQFAVLDDANGEAGDFFLPEGFLDERLEALHVPVGGVLGLGPHGRGGNAGENGRAGEQAGAQEQEHSGRVYHGSLESS